MGPKLFDGRVYVIPHDESDELTLIRLNSPVFLGYVALRIDVF